MSVFNWFKRAEPAPIEVQPTRVIRNKRADERIKRILLAIDQGQSSPELLQELASLQEDA